MIENSGSSPVSIKGFGDSLRVTVNAGQPSEIIREELVRAFEKLNHLVKNAKIILDTGHSAGHEDLFKSLSAFLMDKYALASITKAEPAALHAIPPEQHDNQSVYMNPVSTNPASMNSGSQVNASGSSLSKGRIEEKIRLRDAERGWEFRKSEVLMIAGRVRAGQRVNAKKHLVVMGDVNPGAEISAAGDILVMGSLCGTAMAGLPDNDSAIILALDFRPTQIQIAGVVAAGHKAGSLKTAEFARIDAGNIVVEPFLGNNPFAKMPWPEVR